MKKIELTKKGKIVFISLGILIVLAILLTIIFNKNSKVSNIILNTYTLTDGDYYDYGEDSLILHIGSKVQLSYTTFPKEKEIEILFNNYDDDIISIDSKGILTALKTGKTELQIFDKNNISSNAIKIYVY